MYAWGLQVQQQMQVQVRLLRASAVQNSLKDGKERSPALTRSSCLILLLCALIASSAWAVSGHLFSRLRVQYHLEAWLPSNHLARRPRVPSVAAV